jgi:hypothetical protein
MNGTTRITWYRHREDSFRDSAPTVGFDSRQVERHFVAHVSEVSPRLSQCWSILSPPAYHPTRYLQFH